MRVLLLTTLLLAVSAADARAQDANTLKKIDDLDRIALDELDLGDAAAAQKQLEAAISTAKAARLDKHAVTARLHLHLAIALGAGAADAAKQALDKAVAIDPAIVLPEEHRTPALVKLLDEVKAARAKVSTAPASQPASQPAPPDGPIAGIAHAPIDRAAEGAPIVVEAVLGAELKATKQVNLFYRAPGAKTYVTVPMKKTAAASWRAEIPAAATAAESLQYYIDARNAKAKVLASKATAQAPFEVAIVRKAAAVAADTVVEEEEEEENPLEELKR